VRASTAEGESATGSDCVQRARSTRKVDVLEKREKGAAMESGVACWER
jgi:hypothetical protein